jgi:hypothetical protein
MLLNPKPLSPPPRPQMQHSPAICNISTTKPLQFPQFISQEVEFCIAAPAPIQTSTNSTRHSYNSHRYHIAYLFIFSLLPYFDNPWHIRCTVDLCGTGIEKHVLYRFRSTLETRAFPIMNPNPFHSSPIHT